MPDDRNRALLDLAHAIERCATLLGDSAMVRRALDLRDKAANSPLDELGELQAALNRTFGQAA